MRRALSIVLALTLALSGFAGCIGNEDPTEAGNDAQPGANGDDQRPPLPDPISASNDVQASSDPTASAAGECATPAASCDAYNFTANTTVRINAVLTWGQQTNDFDLYLFKNGTQVAASASEPPATEERINVALVETGEYRILVQPFVALQDTYTLNATFQYA